LGSKTRVHFVKVARFVDVRYGIPEDVREKESAIKRNRLGSSNGSVPLFSGNGGKAHTFLLMQPVPSSGFWLRFPLQQPTSTKHRLRRCFSISSQPQRYQFYTSIYLRSILIQISSAARCVQPSSTPLVLSVLQRIKTSNQAFLYPLPKLLSLLEKVNRLRYARSRHCI
jgi:hypothetical protein